MINRYTNNNKKIILSDWNTLIDDHNKNNSSFIEEKTLKKEYNPAEIIVTGSSSVDIKKITWTRNGIDCSFISNNYSNTFDGQFLEDSFIPLTFSSSDFTSTTEMPNYDGMVYIGAVLSNCSSTENNNNFSEMLDGTIVQLDNPRTNPNKIHIVKLPIDNYNNSNSQVNTCFYNSDSTLKIIGGVKIDNSGYIVDVYNYVNSNIIDTYKQHPFEIYVFNNTQLKVNDGNVIENNVKYSYTSATWDTGDITSLTDGLNYIYASIIGGVVVVTASTDLFPNYGDNLIGEVTYSSSSSKITNIKQLINNDITISISTPVEATYNKNLVDGLMGGDAVNEETWQIGDEDSEDNPLGCYFYVLSRVEYDEYNEKQINIFTRKMTIGISGGIVKIGAETKYSIQTVPHSSI